MQTCPRCGQLVSNESHQCAPTTKAADQVAGARSAISALVILVLSFGLFVATLAFTALHQQASAAPVIIQTTLPTNDATITPIDQGITTPPASSTPTATVTKHSGGSGATQPTPPPKAPTPTTPPLPTTVPPTPTPTDTPQPTPTRLPQ